VNYKKSSKKQSGSDTYEITNLLLKLRDSYLDSFDKRRNNSWKICLSLWTLLSIIFGTIILEKINLPIEACLGVIFTIILLSIFFLHVYWIYGFARANGLDKEKAYYIEVRIINILEIKFPESITHPMLKLNKNKAAIKKIFTWAHGFQIGVTLLLVILDILFSWSLLIK
jgi:hypothetical protein